ncbi:MAG TPA: inorganic diphosphatase [Candidatus Paceibacterota bacterium]|nr:inorganic diphosphatase [Candidatus Paceibacterota bacterium]
MSNNIWETIPTGDKSPNVVNVVIEIPKGSNNKYELDEKLGVIKLDRVFYSPFFYPLDYGFIPQTRSEDGDHLDALVIGSDPVPVGCLVEARPIGMLNMIDSGEADAKILAVQAKNPRFDTIKSIKDIEQFQPHLLKEIVHFFEHYKDLQGKKVETKGWDGVDAAHAEIKKAQDVYAKEK